MGGQGTHDSCSQRGPRQHGCKPALHCVQQTPQPPRHTMGSTHQSPPTAATPRRRGGGHGHQAQHRSLAHPVWRPLCRAVRSGRPLLRALQGVIERPHHHQRPVPARGGVDHPGADHLPRRCGRPNAPDWSGDAAGHQHLPLPGALQQPRELPVLPAGQLAPPRLLPRAAPHPGARPASPQSAPTSMCPQIELGTVPGGTVLTVDDVEVWNGLPAMGTTPPPPLPPPPAPTPPPPPPPPAGGGGALIAAASDNFNGAAPYKITVAAFAGAAATASYAGGEERAWRGQGLRQAHTSLAAAA